MAKKFFTITGTLGVLFITAGIGAADRLFIVIEIGCIALILIFVWAELYLNCISSNGRTWMGKRRSENSSEI